MPPAMAFRADPRSTFKDSYLNRTAYQSTQKAPKWSQNHGEAFANDAEQRHLLELKEARAEISQLRNALRATASALQHAASLLPIDLGLNLQAHGELLNDFTSQLRSKDEEILDLARRATQSERQAAGQKGALLLAMQRWGANGGQRELIRMPWEAWKGVQKERAEKKRFQEAMSQGRASLQPTVLKVLEGFASKHGMAEARIVFTAWGAVVRDVKHGKEKTVMRQEKVRATLLRWTDGFAVSAQSVCWSAWKMFRASLKHEQDAEASRKEHVRVAKEMKRQAVERAAMTLFAGGSQVLHIVLKEWRECALTTRAQKAVLSERQRASQSEERTRLQAVRNFAFLMQKDNHALVALYFAMWHDNSNLERQAKVDSRRQIQHQLFIAWCAVTGAGRHVRDLEKEKAALQAREVAHHAELEAHRKQREGIMNMADSKANPLMLMRVVWSSWRESTAEVRREQEREQEKQAWKEQFEAEQRQIHEQERRRAVLGSLAGSSEMTMRIVWSAWISMLLLHHHENELDGAHMVFEAQQLKSMNEAEHLKLAVRAAELKHHDLHQKRKALFLASMDDRDKTMIIHVTWSAWRECVQDGRITEIKKLRGLWASSQLAPARKPSCCWRTFCCCCSGGGSSKQVHGGEAAAKPGSAKVSHLTPRPSLFRRLFCCASSAKPHPDAEGLPKATAAPKVTPEAEAKVAPKPGCCRRLGCCGHNSAAAHPTPKAKAGAGTADLADGHRPDSKANRVAGQAPSHGWAPSAKGQAASQDGKHVERPRPQDLEDHPHASGGASSSGGAHPVSKRVSPLSP